MQSDVKLLICRQAPLYMIRVLGNLKSTSVLPVHSYASRSSLQVSNRKGMGW